jgi:hypothetical protein
VTEFKDNGGSIKYYKQNRNLGFDGNIRFLYKQVNTEYLWFFADDDIPISGSLKVITNTLETHKPTVLLFSFIQPLGSTMRQFDYPEPVHILENPKSIIEHILRYPKISILILNRVEFTQDEWQRLINCPLTGFKHLILTFAVLDSTRCSSLAVISQPQATCDDEFHVLRWTPWMFLEMHKAVNQPYVNKYLPLLPSKYKINGYYNAIQFMFANKTGKLIAENQTDYDRFISEFEYCPSLLIKRPRAALQLFAIKLGIAGYWPQIRSVLKKLDLL